MQKMSVPLSSQVVYYFRNDQYPSPVMGLTKKTKMFRSTQRREAKSTSGYTPSLEENKSPGIQATETAVTEYA